MKTVLKYLPILFILSLSYWAVKPFFYSGFFTMHDATQVARVFEMGKSLSDGMIPVRWVADLGYYYGYPLFNFYAPFSYFVGGVIMLFGFDALLATKSMMVLGILLAGIGMYLFARQIWGNAGGFISGLLYLYAPYHAVDIYVRGDVAEFWAYAFIPFAFLGIYKIFILLNEKKDTRGVGIWTVIIALSYSGIILSHNLTALMVSPFLFITAVFLYLQGTIRGYKNYYFILVGLVLGIIISAFYTVPVFFEMGYTNVISQIGGGSNYHDHFICLSQLWSSPWGFGGSAPGCIAGLSFKIGKLHILLSLFSFVSLFILWKRQKGEAFFILAFILFLFISVFLMLKESLFIWQAIPHMAFFQFPWRFLIVASFFTAFLSGSSIWVLKYSILQKSSISRNIVFIVLVIVLIGSIIFNNEKVFYPQTVLPVTAADLTTNKELSFVASKISDEYMPKAFVKPQRFKDIPRQKVMIPKSTGTVEMISEKTQTFIARVTLLKPTSARLAIAYFPAWHIYLDDKEIPFVILVNGLAVDLPQGQHTLKAHFRQTSIEQTSNAISLLGIFSLLGIILYTVFLRRGK